MDERATSSGARVSATPLPRAAPSFDYSEIPLGYYDEIARRGNPIRRLWHLSKFERVIDYLPTTPGQSVLDIGCFAGTFLSLLDTSTFARQLGVDVLPDQIAYASRNHGCSEREFRYIESVERLDRIQDGPFDCITLIEVIEHLTPEEIRAVLREAARLLKTGGSLVVTTPNYESAWPAIEYLLNRYSDVSYEEQHITKFSYRNIARKLTGIYPQLEREFDLAEKTTTHFVTPFLAGASFRIARALSRAVPHKLWRVPVGNLVLTVFSRR